MASSSCLGVIDMYFHAHSTGRADKADWQPLAEHLLGVGKQAAAKAAPFGGQVLADAAGCLHDLGKYTREFQNRLTGDLHKVDHATWGARIARERYGGIGTLLAYGIAGHHAGLANSNPEQYPPIQQRSTST